jgi:hypothetical protein
MRGQRPEEFWRGQSRAPEMRLGAFSAPAQFSADTRNYIARTNKDEQMRFTRGWLGLAALVGVAAVVSGCSSGGIQGPVATGSSAASRQFAAALFVEQWGQILWGLVTTQSGTQTPASSDPVTNPDGSISRTFTTADGTVVDMVAFPDGSARLDITWPDGHRQSVSQSIPEFDLVSKTTIHWVVQSDDGLRVDYTSVVDDRGTPYDISDDTTELRGSSVLPGGLTQEFVVLTAAGQTALQSKQSDGSDFNLTVPMAAPEFMFPDFSRPSTGTYAAGGLELRFTIASTTGAPSRWATMLSDLSGGVTGQFSLNPDLSGSGQLVQNGQPQALLSWTRAGETQVSFLTAERSSTSPAGAAVDYLVHRWQTLTALMAPAPGVRASSARPPITYRTGITVPK